MIEPCARSPIYCPNYHLDSDMQIPIIEKASSEDIAVFQDEKVLELMSFVKKHSVFYQKMAARTGIDLDRIRSVADLRQLPFTTKEDLHRFNAEFLCVPRDQVIDYVTTSGTSGDPVLFGLTDSDLDRLAYNEALSFQSMDLRRGDVIQLTTTLDRRFMAGMAYFLGARKATIGVIRVGSGVPELQWDTIAKIRPKALVAVPSFLLKMLEYATANGIDFKSSSVEKILCIGESIRQADFAPNTLAKRILEQWPVTLYGTFASTEMATAFTECGEGVGGHLHPELIIAEFVDEQDQAVRPGEPGELVVTTLGMEGMPLVRFKTGDIVQAHWEACACGRSTMRLGPVLGRKNQMIKYKGTTLYPPALFDLLNDFADIENYIVEIDADEMGGDEIIVRLGSSLSIINDETRQNELLMRVKDRFRAKLRVSPKIIIDEIEKVHALRFPPNARKAINFIDRRVH